MRKLTWLSRRQALAWTTFVIVAVGIIAGLSRCEGKQNPVDPGFKEIVFADSVHAEADSTRAERPETADTVKPKREKRKAAPKAPKQKHRPKQRDFLGEEIPGSQE